MTFSIFIDPEAIKDIQQAIDYYEEQEIGLGKRFEESLNKHLLVLEKHPFFNIRYDNVRCLPMKKFPFMLHFTVDESLKSVILRAVFHTSINPEKWSKRIKNLP